MWWLALEAHISSKWWGCQSARPAAAAADRSCVPWAAVASRSCRALCQVATWFRVRWEPGGVLLVPWRLVHTPHVPAAGSGPGSRVVGPVVAAVSACFKTDRMPHVLFHRSAVGVRVLQPSFACDFPGLTCPATPGAVGRGHGVCPLGGGPASGLG